MSEVINNVVVVKVGTNTLIKKNEDGSEQLDRSSFQRIGKQIISLQEQGTHVAVVSSAAITAGMVATGLKKRPDKKKDMPGLQRLASIGWRHVLNEWDAALPGANIGELLLTQRELASHDEQAQALGVAHRLMVEGDIAVANENDAISHKEIAFGDNDTLAATFAAKIGRSALFGDNIRLMLLSDVHGVYRDMDDPSSVIPEIDNIARYEHLAGDAESENSTGGMLTKFGAAKIATPAGVEMWIAHGKTEDVIARAFSGEVGTHFLAAPTA
jgi:glutamate 5-kinase